MNHYTIDLEQCYYDKDERTYNIVKINAKGEREILSEPVDKKNIEDTITLKKVTVQGKIITLETDGVDFAQISQMRILMFQQKGEECIILPIQSKKNGILQFEVTDAIKEHLTYKRNKTFRVCLEYIEQQQYYLKAFYDGKIKDQMAEECKKHAIKVLEEHVIEQEIWLKNPEDEIQEFEHIALMYINQNGRLQFCLARYDYWVRTKQFCNMLKFSMKRGKLKLKLEFDENGYEFKKLILKYRYKIEADARQYEFQVEEISNKNGIRTLQANLDLHQVDFRNLYWDVKVIFYNKKKDEEYELPLKLGNYKKKFKSFFFKDEYLTGDGNFLYPYVAAGDILAFQYREKSHNDTMAFRYREVVAGAIYKLFKGYWKKKNIYLVYEKFCIMAQDNGYYFFQYCMEHDVEKQLNGKILYVLDKNSKDFEKVAKYKDHVIEFMSLKYMVYLLAAKLLISTDTKIHAYAWGKRYSKLFGYVRQKKLVFLQHGVTALKRVDFLYGKGKKGGSDLFVVTSDYEKKIVCDYFGYPSREVAVTGFARWDVLHDKSKGLREILVMPTWRNYLEDLSEDLFKESDYYKNYMEFLNSERLKSILEKYDLHLNFYLHTKFRDYLKEFAIENDRIRLIPFGEEPLNEIMMRCKMLITDYSSVCWDVFYQDKPVLFYQFDLDTYLEAHGSYMDIRKEIFGDRVEQLSPLYDLIEEYAKQDFAVKPVFEEMRKGYFKYIDDDNSKRIVEAIQKMKL